MREDWPSLTALYVTYGRALATRDPILSRACVDPYAERLLPRPLVRLLALGDHGRAGRLLHGAQKGLTLGLAAHLALRTALIDRALEHAIASGIDQVVLLGAGYDTRAHRMQALAGATVYEVDHPATQRSKRSAARALPIAARELRYVACDFERMRLDDALRAAGFAPTRRAAFVWEGVTMYLARAAVDESLRAIARLAVDESLLLATYMTPEIVHSGHALGRLSAHLLALIAEPIRFAAIPSELGKVLAAAGFEVLSDAAPRDAAPHFGIELEGVAPLLPSERLVVAKKGSNTP